MNNTLLMQLKTNITAVRFVIVAIANVVNANQVSQPPPTSQPQIS